MAEVQTYLLKWDLDKFRDQIADSQATYTKFGSALRDLVGAVSGDLTALQQRASAVSSTLVGLTPQIERSVQTLREGSSSANQLLESIARSGSRIAADMSRATAGAPGAGKGPQGSPPGVDKAEAQVEGVKASAIIALDMANEALSKVSEALKIIERNKKALKAEMTAAEKLMKDELKNAAAKVKEVVSHMPGGVLSSGLLGGLLGAMILGYTETDRVKALSGEVLNVFEATGESLSSKAGIKAREFFTGPNGFVEKAQWFYGISKEESMGVLKTMVDAGYKGKQISASFNKSLGEVGSNVAVLSMAVDKHFNQDTGTSMNNIIQITTSLGDSLKDATDKYTRLAFAGQRSAMGVSKFTDSVISGASAMQQYGVDVEDVASMMSTVQKHYQDMGLSPQYAGDRATQAVSGLMTSMANMNPAVKALVMQRINPGLSGLDARQAFEDGFKRVISGEDKNFASKAAMALYQYAAEGRDRSGAIKILEGVAGMQNQPAATLVDTKGELVKVNALTELNQKETANLKNSLITEGERLSALAKMQRELYKAIASIGKGLLKILTGLVGVLVMGFKSLPVLIMALIPGSQVGWAELNELSRKFDALSTSISSGAQDMKTGFGMLPDIFGKEFSDDLKPLLDVLKYDVPKYASGGVEMPSPFESMEENARRVKAIKEEMISDITELVADEDTRNMLIGEIKSGVVTSRGLASYIKSREDAKTRERFEGKKEAVTPKLKMKDVGLKYKPLNTAEIRAAAKKGAILTAGQQRSLTLKVDRDILKHMGQ